MGRLVADLTPEIRSAKAPDRPIGHSVRSTADLAPDPAVTDPTPVPARGAQADFPAEGVGGPARRDQANHFGWRLQAGMEIRSYAETIAVRDVEEEAVVQIDPAIATIWRISAAGSFSISISDIPESTVGGTAASRVVSLVLYVQRVAGAEIGWPAGTLAGEDVLDPDGDGDRGDSLLAAPDAGRLDVFVLNKVPTVGWVLYVAALGLSAV